MILAVFKGYYMTLYMSDSTQCNGHTMLYVHTHTNLPHMRKFSPGETFANFAICSHWRNFYHANFLSYVNDYIEDMATFTALAKIYSTKYFCNTKISVLGEIFVKLKFSCIRYIYNYIYIYMALGNQPNN